MRLNEPWTWLGVGLSLVGLILVLVNIAYSITEPWNIVLTHLGSILVGAGIVELISYGYISKHLITRATHEITKAMNLGISAFYENRAALLPLPEELKGVKDVWAMWHVGTVMSIQGQQLQQQLRKLVLTHPESNQLKALEKICPRSASLMSQDITGFTQAMMRVGVEVRWFDGPIQNSITIADPESDKAWIRVEIVIPMEETGARPSFRLEKAKSRELFQSFYDSFQKMWKASKTPPP